MGKTLFHSLWTGLLVYAVTRLLLLQLPGKLAAARYRVAFGTLLLYTAGMAALFAMLYDPTATGTVRESGYGLSVLAEDSREAGPGWLWKACYLSSMFYLGGILVAFARFIQGLLRVAGIRRNAESPKPIWSGLFRELAAKAGIRGHIRLLISVRAQTPFLTGFFRPVVIVPASAFVHLPVSQVELILMHELYHAKRLDHLAIMVQRIITMLFFYHPAIRAIGRMADLEREHCCDDHILSSGRPRVEYAKVLLGLAHRNLGAEWNASIAATGAGDHQLKNRIRRILNQENMRTTRKGIGPALTLLALSLAAVLIMSGFGAGLSIQKHKQVPQELQETHRSPEPARQVISYSDPAPSPSPEVVVLPDTLGQEEMDAIRKDMEEARKRMEEIDWDAIREDMEEARQQAMEEIDWDAIREEMEEARRALDDIDWDSIREEMEEARRQAMEEMDWDAIGEEMEEARRALDDIDWEQLQQEMDAAWDEVHLDQLRDALEGMHLDLDSLMRQFHLEHDFDFEIENDPPKQAEPEQENDLDI